MLAINAPASSYLLLLLGFLALLVVYLLIALVEGVALSLLSWNPFRISITVSVIMNLIAGVINGVLLVLLQHQPLVWLPVSFILSLLIDTAILTYFKRQATWQNAIFALLVNLGSYILLILPAYYFGTHP